MASDAFIVPTNPDPFSLMAIGTLGKHLVKWNEWKISNFNKFKDADYPLYPSTPVFIGTLNSRFNKHASKAARKFDERIQQIDTRVDGILVPELARHEMVLKDECYRRAFDQWAAKLPADNKGVHALARIPDFQALIHTANLANLPIFKLDAAALRADSIQGNVRDQALRNISSFNDIFEAVAGKIELLCQDDCRKG